MVNIETAFKFIDKTSVNLCLPFVIAILLLCKFLKRFIWWCLEENTILEIFLGLSWSIAILKLVPLVQVKKWLEHLRTKKKITDCLKSTKEINSANTFNNLFKLTIAELLVYLVHTCLSFLWTFCGEGMHKCEIVFLLFLISLLHSYFNLVWLGSLSVSLI